MINASNYEKILSVKLSYNEAIKVMASLDYLYDSHPDYAAELKKIRDSICCQLVEQIVEDEEHGKN